MLFEIIGKEIIIETMKKVLSVLTDLEDHEDPFVNQTINDLDIDNKILIITTLINMPLRPDDTSLFHQAIHLCCKNLNESIDNIRTELEEIHRLVPLHKEKWFHTWRIPEYYKNIDKLKKYDTVMDKRMALFLNVLKTYHSFS